jgi:hypothetical protein
MAKLNHLMDDVKNIQEDLDTELVGQGKQIDAIVISFDDNYRNVEAARYHLKET